MRTAHRPRPDPPFLFFSSPLLHSHSLHRPGKARLGHAKGWLLLGVYVLVMGTYALAGTLCKAIYDFHELYVDLECKLFTSSNI